MHEQLRCTLCQPVINALSGMQWERFGWLFITTFSLELMRRYICLGLHGKVFKLTKEIERRKWALLTHSNTAHMHIQTHRYALEQGALCVHVLYLEYVMMMQCIYDIAYWKCHARSCQELASYRSLAFLL